MIVRMTALMAVVLALALLSASTPAPSYIERTVRLSDVCLVCGETVSKQRGYVVMPGGCECIPCYKP